MATIRDVANRAGVSIATVSRTLSNPAVVSEGTRTRILSVVEELGYTPHAAAQSLRTTRSQRILVSVPDISNPFFAKIIRGAEDAARTAGYAIVIGDTRHDADREDQYAQMVARRQVDGLIFLGHRLPDAVQDLVRREGARAPIVNGCEYSLDLPVSSVHIDNADAATTAMNYLYGLGHERIGVITGPMASPISQDRLSGVRAAAHAHGRSPALTVIDGDFSVESGEIGASALLGRADRPTAIFSFSDEMAIGALSAIRSSGLRCPDDISLLGFDDIRYAHYLSPSLSTIAQPSVEIGQECVRLLVDILDGTITSRSLITLPHQLIVRDSTAPNAAREGRRP